MNAFCVDSKLSYFHKGSQISVCPFFFQNLTLTQKRLKIQESSETLMGRLYESLLGIMNKKKRCDKPYENKGYKYMGHIRRCKNRFQLFKKGFQGKIYNKRGPGKRRISWVSQTSTELLRGRETRTFWTGWSPILGTNKHLKKKMN